MKCVFLDWALTLNYHPWTLGFATRDKGMIPVGGKVDFHLAVVLNMWDQNQSGYRGVTGSENPIPSKVRSLSVKGKSGAGIWTVIVVEHQNVDFKAGMHKEHLDRLIIIQVSYHVDDAHLDHKLNQKDWRLPGYGNQGITLSVIQGKDFAAGSFSLLRRQ